MEEALPLIYADLNETDADGRFWLQIAGATRDIERYGAALRPGMRVKFNVQDEFEVEGFLEVDAAGFWLGRPDPSTWRRR